MTRAASIFAGFAVTMAAASPCAAANVAAAPAHAAIVDPATLQVNWALAQPTVQGIPQGAAFVGTMPALGLGLTLPGQARLIIRREDDTGAPVTAPGAFEVAGGNDALIIRTSGGATLGPVGPRTIAGGELIGGKAASIDVARGLIRAPDAPGLPAPQTLVVVVQYN
jgi:hypothetical protein